MQHIDNIWFDRDKTCVSSLVAHFLIMEEKLVANGRDLVSVLQSFQ